MRLIQKVMVLQFENPVLAPARPLHVRQLQVEHPCHWSDCVPGWEPVYYPLAPGHCSWACRHIQIDPFQVFEQTYGCATLLKGKTRPGFLGLALCQMGWGSATYIGNAIPENNLLLLNSEQDFYLKTASECKMTVLLCPIHELLAAGASQPGSLSADDLQRPGLYCSETKLHTDISTYVNYFFDFSTVPTAQDLHSQDIQAIRHLLLSKILRLAAWALTADSTQVLYQQPSHRRQLVEQLETLMLNNLENSSLTQEQLCEHVGKSQRTIYYAFDEVYGVPPMEYYKFLRLRAVRQRLKRSDLSSTTVTQIATSYGFCHMGQFACDYKKLFGESPSSTLKCPSSQEDGAIATT